MEEIEEEIEGKTRDIQGLNSWHKSDSFLSNIYISIM